jgi:hypothetical protein
MKQLVNDWAAAQLPMLSTVMLIWPLNVRRRNFLTTTYANSRLRFELLPPSLAPEPVYLTRSLLALPRKQRA